MHSFQNMEIVHQTINIIWVWIIDGMLVTDQTEGGKNYQLENSLKL